MKQGARLLSSSLTAPLPEFLVPSSCLQLHASLMESMLSKADLHLAEHTTQADLVHANNKALQTREVQTKCHTRRHVP